tara:strand:+ start:1888 stop:2259 length:372 start_codon:yes stop_codon:yes gene_type:complete
MANKVYNSEIMFNELMTNLNNELEAGAKRKNIPVPYKFRYEFGKFHKELHLDEGGTTKNFRTLRIYKDVLTTNERVLVTEQHYISNNPSVFLKNTWKDRLCKDFLKGAFNLRIVSLTKEQDEG